VNCQNCSLRNMPYSLELGGNYGYNGDGCPSRTLVRTEVGNFYACPMCMNKFGRGTPYGQPGWYPGRGY
jgi:hypothetical protein